LIERKLLLENLLRLRSRIEDWTQSHGWENMDNYREKKDGKGRVVWKLSDWEFVDNMYKAVYNFIVVCMVLELYLCTKFVIASRTLDPNGPTCKENDVDAKSVATETQISFSLSAGPRQSNRDHYGIYKCQGIISENR